ncbi:AMP-binding protein [Spirillospora sp. NPDC029432]|uniref:class I adenylate-forming enzyme family protein n=1 Tax=Spirillospora sp. NPDC029432 TaxID=3154599 RepID=UPI0034512DAB
MTGTLGRAVLAGLRAAGGRDVLVAGGRRLGGDEVLAMAAAGAARLTARGVRPGAAVACLYGASPESAVARLVTLVMGCRYVHLAAGMPVAPAAAVMRAMGAAALLWDPSREEDAGPLLAACPVPVRAPLDAALLAPSAVAGPVCAAGAGAVAGPGAISAVMFSSGTSGARKAVAYGHRTEAAHLAAARKIFGPGPWRLLAAPGVQYLPALFTLWTLAGGGTVVLEPAVDDAARLAGLIERERLTHVMAGRPVRLYGVAPDLGAPPNGLRQLIYGGEPAVPARTAALTGRLGGVLTQTYGTTEGGFLTALAPGDHRRADLLASAGRAVPGVELRVRDPAGTDLPPGEAGEVWARTEQVMLGYLGDPERTAGAVRGGWLRTGDLGRLDEDGYLFLLDRAPA